MSVLLRRVTLLLLVLGSVSCGPSHYETYDNLLFDKEAQVEENQVNRELLEVVSAYHQAVQKKDLVTLKQLVSDEYYENAGTTDTTEDDYGYKGVDATLSRFDVVDTIKCEITVRDVRVEGERAQVFYEFSFNYLFKVDGVPKWESGREVNRMDLIREEESGLWKIYRGL